MRVAALDLGSNTSLLLIADVDSRGITKTLLDRTTITKLGQGVHATRRLHPEALARMQKCLDDYKSEIAKYECERVIAVATSAARDVSNGHELIEMGKARGIPIHIIGGASEAKLTFRGALFDRLDTAGVAVIDVGGGSTEIITHDAAGISGTSVDVGSVRLTELFVKSDPIAPTELTQLQEYADQAFAKAIPAQDQASQSAVDSVVAVAGTPTTLATLDQGCEFSETKVHGYKLTARAIEHWIEKLSAMNLKDRAALPGMDRGREDVIVAGATILLSALKRLGIPELTVSIRGVRYGVAMSWSEF
jgi:exopolyphosphatase/guanosine-5'-triphosphate,3'-diphosphate pyrophosphatase